MSKKDKENKEEKSCLSVPLSWYPGHMAKTKKQIMEDLKLIDLVVEILDARIPISSQNPDMQEIVGQKKKIILLNKSDLADNKENDKWVKEFAKQGIVAILTDANTGKGIKETIQQIEKKMQEELQKEREKGRVGKTIKTLVLGIPNVGKSSFINRIAKKNSAQVGNRPGVTKQKQWIKVASNIQLLDTPGVLWPKFESEQVALNLSFTGTIKDELLQRTEVGYYLLKFLLNHYEKEILQRYKIEKQIVEEIKDKAQSEENFVLYVMQVIAKKRGAIASGGQIDEEKVANLILDDFRSGKIGRITLERVGEKINWKN